MPSATDILLGLETLANQWTVVAVVWHGVLAAAMVAYAAGWRPTRRLSAQLLAVPLASVSVFAWIAGNPFNGAAFAMVAVLSFSIGRRLPPDPGVLAPRWAVAGGLALLAFGWVYPHFLRTEGWLAYGYAAPVGLVPCPTLSVVVGVGLILDGLRSRAWSLAIAATGVMYGLPLRSPEHADPP